VDPNAALGFALVTNLVSFAPPALLGAWFIWRSGLSLGRVVSLGKRATEEESEAEPTPVRADLTPRPPSLAGTGVPSQPSEASPIDETVRRAPR